MSADLNSIQLAEFIARVSKLVNGITGIQLGAKQKSMVESRLFKRALELGLTNLAEYEQYFVSHQAQELDSLISLLTTHHTYFFREFSQFEFLLDTALPKMLPAIRARADKTLKIWSVACSRGQEAYSLAMYLAFHLPRVAPDIKFEIIGSDIDPESVSIANNAVYHRDEIKSVPMNYLGNHWIRGSGQIENYVKAKSSIKNNCKFFVSNLFKSESYEKFGNFDVIFCRNVFIYFNPDQISDITRRLLKQLHPHGHLFLGISETLHGLTLPIDHRGPSIYGHKGVVPAPTANVTPIAQTPKPAAPVATPETIRVFCVDDSPSIHTLMKQILKKESGFEIVGSAINGLDASEKLKTIKADILTLDIHMPEQDGLEYLQKNFNSQHPPVVMVSSVSRENSDLALKALQLGASDYVEKPALSNLKERADEIQTKLKCAFRAWKFREKTNLELDQSFEQKVTIPAPEAKLRVIIANYSDAERLAKTIKKFSFSQPPLCILVDSKDETLVSFNKKLSEHLNQTVIDLSPSNTQSLVTGKIYSGTFSSFENLLKDQASKPTAIMVLGEIRQSIADQLLKWTHAQLILEDLGNGKGSKALMDVASDIVPFTSFDYLSSTFLGKAA